MHKPTNLNTSLEVNTKNIDTGVRFSPHIDAGKVDNSHYYHQSVDFTLGMCYYVNIGKG